MNRRLLFVVAVLLSVTSTSAAELPTEHTIGQIEAVFESRGAMPTGVSVAPNGRIFVNFPRSGDDVPFTVDEIRGGRVTAYPDAEMNRGDKARPGKTFISVQSMVTDAAIACGRWILPRLISTNRYQGGPRSGSGLFEALPRSANSGQGGCQWYRV
jgi:hypothetical protein